MANSIKTTGIVLKSSPHTKDASRLLEIFSPEIGKFYAVIRGVEKPKARLAVVASPFCFGEFVLAEKAGRYTITDCMVYDTFYELAYNLDSYVLGSAMLETVGKLCQEGQSDIVLFKTLIDCLKVMCYENPNPTAVFIKFLFECLNLSGFGFNLGVCASCGKNLEDETACGLEYENSGAVCLKCQSKIQSIRLDSGEWAILKNIYNLQIDQLSNLKFSSREKLTEAMKDVVKQFYYRTNEKISCLNKYLE